MIMRVLVVMVLRRMKKMKMMRMRMLVEKNCLARFENEQKKIMKNWTVCSLLNCTLPQCVCVYVQV